MRSGHYTKRIICEKQKLYRASNWEYRAQFMSRNIQLVYCDLIDAKSESFENKYLIPSMFVVYRCLTATDN